MYQDLLIVAYFKTVISQVISVSTVIMKTEFTDQASLQGLFQLLSIY